MCEQMCEGYLSSEGVWKKTKKFVKYCLKSEKDKKQRAGCKKNNVF